MQMREEAAARKIATWLARVRTRMHGTAYTNEKMRLYVVSEAKLAAESAGGGLTATGVVSESTAIFDQYAS